MRSPLWFLLDRAPFSLFAAAWLVFLDARPAFAQMDEPHGYIEPCTIANYQEMMTECDLCSVPPRDPEACSKRLSPLGYEKKCRTRGDAASFGEVWCVDVKKRPVATKSGGHGSKLPLAAVLAALLLGGILLLWRSRAGKLPPS